MTALERRERELAAVASDPAAFARGFLGVELWDTQTEILRAIPRSRRVAVKACHASSKTFTAAIITLWWITYFEDGIVLTTAPTWLQVEQQLWREIRRLAAVARIEYAQPTKTELRLGPNRFAMGISTDRGVRFQGYHGHILVIIDEAPGVSAETWEAIEGIRAGDDVHVLALGNPTSSGGPFYEVFTSGGRDWETFTISAFDTPNLRGLTIDRLLQLSSEELDDDALPYLVRRRWVREKWLEWGRHDAPQWHARVLGEFPQQSDDSLFRQSWLHGWRAAPVVDPDSGVVDVGIDVAGPGKSETVAAVRRDGDLLEVQAWPSGRPAGEVVSLLRRYQRRLRAVKVDSIGLGHFFGLQLRDLGFPVVPVNVSWASDHRENFANLKAQLYWLLRERAAAGELRGLNDELAYSQLASLRFEYTHDGLVRMESKDSMARRGVPSPDRAEAIMLAFVPVYFEPSYDPVYMEALFRRECSIGPDV